MPPIAPAGMYDPALEAQRRSAQRGLGDLTRDTALGNARAAQDLTFGREGLARDRTRGLEDLGLQRDRGFQDVDRQVGLLTRSYAELQRRQAEGAAVAGVTSPGLALRAAQMRAQNMAFDRQPLDLARTRLGEDYTRGTTRLGADYTRAGGALDVQYNRGMTDRGTQLTRARRENTQFGLDVGEQERFQAIQAGWRPPPPTRMYQWPNGSWHSAPYRRRTPRRPNVHVGVGVAR